MKCSVLERHGIPCRNLPVNLQLSVDHLCIPNPYICSPRSMNRKLPHFHKILDTLNGANHILQKLQEEFFLCFQEKKKNQRSSVNDIIDIELSANKLIIVVQELKEELKKQGRQDHDGVRYLSHLINAFETKLQVIIHHLTQFKANKFRRYDINNNPRFCLTKHGNFPQPNKHKIVENRSNKNEFITCEAFTKKNVSEDFSKTREKYLGNTKIKIHSNRFSDLDLYNQHHMRENHLVVQDHPLNEWSESWISHRIHANGRRKIPKAKFNVLPTYCDKSNRDINYYHMLNNYCVKSRHEYCKSKSCYIHTCRNVESGNSLKKKVEKYTTKIPNSATKSQRCYTKSNIPPTGRESLNLPLTNGTLNRNQGYTSRIFKTDNKNAKVFTLSTLNQEHKKQLNEYNVSNKRRLRSGRSNYKKSPRERKLSVCFHSSRQLHPKEKIKSREQSRSKHFKNKQGSGSSVRTFSSTHDEIKVKKKGRKPGEDYIWHDDTHEDRNLNVYGSRMENSPYFNAKKRYLPRIKSNSSSSRSKIDNTQNKVRVRKHVAYSPRHTYTNRLKKDSYYNVNRARRRSPHKCIICNNSSQSNILTTHECCDCDYCISRDRNISEISHKSYYEYVNHPKYNHNFKYKRPSCSRCESGPFCHIQSDVYLPRSKCSKCLIENVDQCHLRNRRKRANSYVTKDRRDVPVNTECDCINESEDPTASCSTELSSFTCTEEQTISDSKSELCESEDLKSNHPVQYLYFRKKSKSGKHKGIKDNCEKVVEYDVLPMNKFSTTTGTNTDSTKTYSMLSKKKNKFTNTERTKTHGSGIYSPAPKQRMKNKATNTLYHHMGEKEVKIERRLYEIAKKHVVDKEMQSETILPKSDVEHDQTPYIEMADKTIQTNLIDRPSQSEKHVQTVQKETQSRGTNPDKIKLTEQNVQTEMKNTLSRGEKHVQTVQNETQSRGTNPDKIKLTEQNVQTEMENTLSRGEKHVQTVQKETQSRGTNPDKIKLTEQNVQTEMKNTLSRGEKHVQTVQKETRSQGINPDKIELTEQNVQTEMRNTLSRGVSPYRFKGLEKDTQTVREETISRGITTENIYRDETDVQTSKKKAVSRGVNTDKISVYDKDVQTLKTETFSRAFDTDKTSFIDRNVQMPQVVLTTSVHTEVDSVEETENTDSASELSMHLVFEKCHDDIYKRYKNGRATRKAAFHSDDIGQCHVNMRKNRAKIHEKYDNMHLTQDNHYKTRHNEEKCSNRLLKQVTSENTTCDRRGKYNHNKVTRNIKISIDNSKRKGNNGLDNAIKGRKTVLIEEDSGFVDSNASYSNCTLRHSYWQSVANEIKDNYHAKV